MKKSVIIAAGCIMTVGAILCGTFAVIAAADQGSEPPAQESSAVETVTIDPVFQASEHIKGRYNEVKDQMINADNAAVKQIVLEKEEFDLDAYNRGEFRSTKNFNESDYENGYIDMRVSGLASEHYSEMLDNICLKIANDGYGDPALVTATNDDRLAAGASDDQFCSLINMTLNAYNDPDYELSDIDRVRLLDWFENAYFQLSMQKRFSDIENNDRVDLTMRAVYNTVMTECGHAPLE